jgi:shikimate kinase
MSRPEHAMGSPLETRRQRIYLTGFMGSGKSTIGPILANTIGYEFADVDRAVERAVGKTVNEIFLESGEDRFRLLERDILARLAVRSRLVIALGGGTIMDEENFRLVTGTGIVVYLKSSPEQLFRRVHRRDDRPVLRDREGQRLDDERLRQRIQDLYQLREPVYAQADFTVLTGERRVGLTVDEIVRRLSPHID